MPTHKLRENVRRNNTSVWSYSFLKAAFSRNFDEFPSQEPVQFHEMDVQVSPEQNEHSRHNRKAP